MEEETEVSNQGKDIERLQEEVKPSNKKVVIFNFILILLIFVGLFIYMIQVDGVDNILQILEQADYKWVVAGLICLVIHWTCEALNLHIPIKKMYANQRFTNSFKVSMLGQLFNNITYSFPCFT